MYSRKDYIQGEIVADGLGERVDEYLSRALLFGFVGSILIAKNEEIILHKGYGLANTAKKTPFTHETIVDIGSLSKQFTATAILYLEQQGLLSIQDPIAEFFTKVPEDKQGITLHHLLTHTSGLPLKHGSDFEYYECNRFIEDVLSLPLSFPPGREYKYSNPAYALLAIIIEELTQQTLQDYLTQTFFKPLGLETVGWYSNPKWNEDQVAQVYVEGENGGSPLTWPGPYRPLLGNGGICCSIGDLYRWMLALKHNHFLTQESTKKLLTPFLEDTAYGWDVLNTKYGRRIWHNGGTDSGANSELTWFPDLDLFIIAFSNHIRFGEDVGYMAIWPIRAILFNKPYQLPPLQPESVIESNDIEKFTGTYQFPGGGEFNLSLQSEFLLLASRGQPAMDVCLFPEGQPPQEYEFYDQTSRLIIEGLMLDDFGVLHEYTLDKKRAQLHEYFLQRWIRSSEESHGAFQNFEILGTTPFKEFFDTTWLHFDFEDGKNGIGIVWKDTKLIRLTETYYPYPVIIPFLRQSETEFMGHNILFNKTLKIVFDQETDGTISGFHIHNGFSSQFIPT